MVPSLIIIRMFCGGKSVNLHKIIENIPKLFMFFSSGIRLAKSFLCTQKIFSGRATSVVKLSAH